MLHSGQVFMTININKKVWMKFTDSQMEDYIQKVFDHYRSHGFPYFSTDATFRQKEFNNLIKYNGDLITDGIVKQTMHGLSLAWSYMPHSWEVQCNDKMTALDAFVDDDTFMRVIRKRIKMGDNMSDNGIRKMLKMFSGVQSVSNFRPTAAYALYRHFLPSGGRILDMSSGFGGRLLGAIKANHDCEYRYTGFEPATKTFDGLESLRSDFGGNMTIDIHNEGSEFIDIFDKIDFAFTSPPYFNTERYSDEPTQLC